MLNKLFGGGAADLVKSVGGVIDNLHTSKEEKLEKGIMGEANMDGSIFISKDVIPGSAQEREVLNHEMRHATDMRIGKLKYSDDEINYNGMTFPRKTIEGKDMIHYDGEWIQAGSTKFPWELDANNGNK